MSLKLRVNSLPDSAPFTLCVSSQNQGLRGTKVIDCCVNAKKQLNWYWISMWRTNYSWNRVIKCEISENLMRLEKSYEERSVSFNFLTWKWRKISNSVQILRKKASPFQKKVPTGDRIGQPRSSSYHCRRPRSLLICGESKSVRPGGVVALLAVASDCSNSE